MIYTMNGFTHNKELTAIKDIPPFEYLAEYQPIEVDIADYEAREAYKRNQAPYFISGTLTEPKRGKEYVLNRDIISLDYDDVELDEQEFINQFTEKLENLNWILFPTIHCYNKKDSKAFRYRLIIEPDRPILVDEYPKVVKTIGHLLGVDYDPKSETVSQLMGLPILTPYTNRDMIITNHGRALPIQPTLQAYGELFKEEQRHRPAYTYNGNGSMKYTAQYMNELLIGVDDGERNVWLTSKLGTMLNQGMNAKQAYAFAHFVNEHCVRPPLDDGELNDLFTSILKREMKKGA